MHFSKGEPIGQVIVTALYFAFIKCDCANQQTLHTVAAEVVNHNNIFC